MTCKYLLQQQTQLIFLQIQSMYTSIWLTKKVFCINFYPQSLLIFFILEVFRHKTGKVASGALIGIIKSEIKSLREFYS